MEDSASDAGSGEDAVDDVDAQQVPCRAVACPPPPPPSPEPSDSVELSDHASMSEAHAGDAVGEDGVEGEGEVAADERGIAKVSGRVHVSVPYSLEAPKR